MPTATSASPLELLTLADAVNQSTNGLTITGPLTVNGALNRNNVQTAITAFAGGGQGSATALTASVHDVTTVGSAGDSVKLPSPAVGQQIVVCNSTANSMNVFPQTGHSINALSANTQVAVAAGKAALFTAVSTTKWIVTVGA